MSQPLRRLAVAVATGRVAGVFLEDDVVVGTKMSRTAAQSEQNAARIVGSWVKEFVPDHMIVEDPKTASRKGKKTKALIERIATTFSNCNGLDLRLPRRQSYQNKYDEAKALAKAYPEIAYLRPKRPPIWMPEPRHMSYFEALSFVTQLKE